MDSSQEMEIKAKSSLCNSLPPLPSFATEIATYVKLICKDSKSLFQLPEWFLEQDNRKSDKGCINWIGQPLDDLPNTRDSFSSPLCSHCNCWCYNQSDDQSLTNNNDSVRCKLRDEPHKFFTVNFSIKIDITVLHVNNKNSLLLSMHECLTRPMPSLLQMKVKVLDSARLCP